MAEIPHNADPGGAHGDPGMPRWVKVFVIIALGLGLLIVILMLAGHGPGRHLP